MALDSYFTTPITFPANSTWNHEDKDNDDNHHPAEPTYNCAIRKTFHNIFTSLRILNSRGTKDGELKEKENESERHAKSGGAFQF